MREETRHWSDEELLLKLYGVGQEDAPGERHLQQCEDCRTRWRQLAGRRAALVNSAGEAQVAGERLRNQRAAVWARIERRRSARAFRWAPAGAAAGMIAAGLLLLGPRLKPHADRPLAAQARMSDQQLFDDAAALSAPEAPQAAAMSGLFEGRNETEEEVAF